MPRLRTAPKPPRPLAQTVNPRGAALIDRKAREDAAWLAEVDALPLADRAQVLTWVSWSMRPDNRRVSHIDPDGAPVQDPPFTYLVRARRREALAALAAERGREATALLVAISEPTLSQILAGHPSDRPAADPIR